MTQHWLHELNDTTPLRLTPAGVHSGMDLTIQNVSNVAYVFLGGEGLSQNSFGFRIAPNEAFSVELPGKNHLYAISTDPSSWIAVLQTGLETGD